MRIQVCKRLLSLPWAPTPFFSAQKQSGSLSIESLPLSVRKAMPLQLLLTGARAGFQHWMEFDRELLANCLEQFDT